MLPCVFLSVSVVVQIRQLNVAMAELDTVKPKKVRLLWTSIPWQSKLSTNGHC